MNVYDAYLFTYLSLTYLLSISIFRLISKHILVKILKIGLNQCPGSAALTTNQKLVGLTELSFSVSIFG